MLHGQRANMRRGLIGHLGLIALGCVGLLPGVLRAQAYGPPDRDAPGDAMIQAYLVRRAERLHATFLEDVESLEDWQAVRPRYQQEYYYMLGLCPMPEKTPLRATVTGVLEVEGEDAAEGEGAGASRQSGYVVEKLHYQSRPRLYVTANLYRPAAIEPGERLPAVLYVCGHSYQGRDGNKTAYQSHGIWFARHGYVCLVLDSLQLGEIGALHHGTYREGRWWWHSPGYAPAGVECLNGMRGIDYLRSRPDVDPERIAVTGISGGGAATFWIAAADRRAAVAVPVSGMADLPSYVGNRVINGHCDCMFLYNTFRWPWTRIAALVAPRPMLLTNSDADRIFPMDANDRIICRLERVYSLYGASDRVDAMVSIGGHAYREDLRRAIYRFINTQLKGDPRPVDDSEVDLVTGRRPNREYPIACDRLRVFPEDSDLPDDELNTTIDEHFVPMAEVKPPEPGAFDAWKEGLVNELRRVSFGDFPERVPAAKRVEQVDAETARIKTEEGIVVELKHVQVFKPTAKVRRVMLLVRGPGAEEGVPEYVHRVHDAGDMLYVLCPRGVGPTRWTTKNPPNYVERSHVLLGRTVDAGRVWDVIAAARYLRAEHDGADVVALGRGAAGVLAAYAALMEPDISAVAADSPPAGHMDPAAPPILNVLRVCDVPEVLGMLAPRRLTLYDPPRSLRAKAAAIYASAGAKEKLAVFKGDP